MTRVNLRKAASYAAKENSGAKDVNVAQASEIISDFLDYLEDEHEYSEVIEMLERR